MRNTQVSGFVNLSQHADQLLQGEASGRHRESHNDS